MDKFKIVNDSQRPILLLEYYKNELRGYASQ